MTADPRKFKQALINVLGNAIKFTGRGGRITIGARIAQSKLELSVRDTGIGMKQHDLVAALERFQQIDSGHTRRHGGTGLGLPIAKSLTELQGGTFSIDSVYGKGTVVTFRMPLAVKQSAERAA
jgi:signal transduction histidine kinase